MTTDKAHTDSERLTEALSNFSVLMLHTFDPTGLLQSRPMTKARLDDDGTIWFVTSSKEAVTKDVAQVSQVSITGQSALLYLAIQGHGHVHKDSEKAAALWNEAMNIWFPDGPTQSDVVLIRFEPDTAEVWDNRGSKGIRFAINAAKAWWKGKAVQDIAPDAAHDHLTL